MNTFRAFRDFRAGQRSDSTHCSAEGPQVGGLIMCLCAWVSVRHPEVQVMGSER